MTTTGTIYLVQYESASAENSCIDKYKMRGVIVTDPTTLWLASVNCYYNFNDRPYYSAITGYGGSLSGYYSIGHAGNTAPPPAVQVDTDSFATWGVYNTGRLIELWFHRDQPDLSSTEFAALYPTAPYGSTTDPLVYHFSEPTGFEIKLRGTYISTYTGGGLPVIGQTTDSGFLVSYDCGSEPPAILPTLPGKTCTIAPPIVPGETCLALYTLPTTEDVI